MNSSSWRKYAEVLEARVKALEAENEVMARRVDAARAEGRREGVQAVTYALLREIGCRPAKGKKGK